MSLALPTKSGDHAIPQSEPNMAPDYGVGDTEAGGA
jgi:hypothetical protein